jgi:predicted phosphodiesterase
MTNPQFRLSSTEQEIIRKHRKGKDNQNILVIGDLHSPFIREGYLEHCQKIYDKYNCNKVIFIGDVIDNHYSSYHEQDPDGFGAGEELDRAIHFIKPFYNSFPKADVCIGNHDAIICRKAFSSGISNRWIRDYDEVLGTHGWTFEDKFEYNGVLYVHGTGCSGKGAINRMTNWNTSIVQGHIHTESFIAWHCTKLIRHFAMQVGCGVDDRSYAMAYARHFTKKYIVSCGVVLDNGRLPIIEPMELT